MYPVKTEDIKTEPKVKTKQEYRGEENVQKTIMTNVFIKTRKTSETIST